MQIPESIRKTLKRPLGELHKDFRRIRELSRDHRIISVGDICTLELFSMNIKPHLAVFDHKYMRKPLDPGLISILNLHFKNPKRYANPAGTLSEKLIKDAGELIENGGGILIDGEEDLTALAFIKAAGEKDIIVYGQPEEGLVVVVPDKEIKKKIEGWLSSFAF